MGRETIVLLDHDLNKNGGHRHHLHRHNQSFHNSFSDSSSATTDLLEVRGIFVVRNYNTVKLRLGERNFVF